MASPPRAHACAMRSCQALACPNSLPCVWVGFGMYLDNRPLALGRQGICGLTFTSSVRVGCWGLTLCQSDMLSEVTRRGAPRAGAHLERALPLQSSLTRSRALLAVEPNHVLGWLSLVRLDGGSATRGGMPCS